MMSLLAKARELKKAAGSELHNPDGLVFDKSSGISHEDQKEILLHIDRVSRSSRILAGPETWRVKPKKRGFGLPLVVNLAGLVVLAGGLFALGKVFAPGETAAASDSAALSSAEGSLLKEIKREAEGRILEKDREIAAIQQRMASLDEEKDQLMSSIDARVQAKEAELKETLKDELDRERRRLAAEGLSEAVIQDRMREFELRKAEEFRSRLDDFARKAEDERLALQATLDKAKDDFKASLSAATAERQRIQDDSRKREQELRSQLDDKNRALEAERAKTAESLRGAQAELARLNEEASRVKSIEDQLLGLYAASRQALRDGRIDAAARSLESLKAYLADAQVSGLPALRSRRELDLFAVDLIERAVSSERAKASADTAQLMAALDSVALARDEVGKARAAVSAGKPEAAEAAYRKALSAMRELEEAGAYIEEGWKARLAEQAASFEAARAAEAAALLTESRNAAAAMAASGEAARSAAGRGLDARAEGKALEAAFSRLLASLPLGPGEASRAYGFIKEAGVRDYLSAKRAQDTLAAATPLRSAEESLAAGRFFEALNGFSAAMARFPAAEQASRANEGVSKAGAGLLAAAEAARAEAASRVGALEASLSAVRAELQAMSERALNAEDGARSASAAAAASGGTAPGSVSSAELAALQAEKTGLEAELSVATARLSTLSAAYLAYAAEEDAILQRGGPLALIEARTRLDAFLSGSQVSALMPGMRNRIARYLTSFQDAGQREVLYNAADIVESAARQSDPAVCARYFQDLESRYSGDDAMLEFLSSVKESLR